MRAFGMFDNERSIYGAMNRTGFGFKDYGCAACSPTSTIALPTPAAK